jgi:hypothetical protein
MLNAIQYFDQKTPGMIIAGKKDGSDDLGVFYTGSLKDLQILRDLINESIDLLQNPGEETAEISIYAA